jgi:hypothetical protein
MKASDVVKKKGSSDGKNSKPASKLIDWISQRRGKKAAAMKGAEQEDK